MPKSHKKHVSRSHKKSQKRRHTRRRRHSSPDLGGYVFKAGGCGCGGQTQVMPAGPGIFKGGSDFQPSFSNLPTSKFYPLNEYQNDPTTMSVNSRLLPNTPTGMSAMRGGMRDGKQGGRSRRRQKQKKMKGGISVGGLLSHASSVVMGNGLSDNIIANQGGINGMITTNQILNGNPMPMTSVLEPVSKLYNEFNKPMA